MNRIKWIKSGTEKFPNYNAKIGPIDLRCRPEMKYSRLDRPGNSIYKWRCSVYLKDKWVVGTKNRKSLENAQKDGEKLAIQYLFGYGFIILKELKKMGILEEMLFEVGIDL